MVMGDSSPRLSLLQGLLPTVRHREYSGGGDPSADGGHLPCGKKRRLGGLDWSH